ncbi:unnamed protein product [Amoebophrya sp. A120]|nr:unnamed protein product [Amoebophrya sp. A120]|eukprot:GSA120T00013749001.1
MGSIDKMSSSTKPPGNSSSTKKSKKAADEKQNALVIGNGIIGLTTAQELSKHGFNVTIVTNQKEPYPSKTDPKKLMELDSLSALAGGWWYPYSTNLDGGSLAVDPVRQKQYDLKVTNWAIATLEKYLEQEQFFTAQNDGESDNKTGATSSTSASRASFSESRNSTTSTSASASQQNVSMVDLLDNTKAIQDAASLGQHVEEVPSLILRSGEDFKNKEEEEASIPNWSGTRRDLHKWTRTDRSGAEALLFEYFRKKAAKWDRMLGKQEKEMVKAGLIAKLEDRPKLVSLEKLREERTAAKEQEQLQKALAEQEKKRLEREAREKAEEEKAMNPFKISTRQPSDEGEEINAGDDTTAAPESTSGNNSKLADQDEDPLAGAGTSVSPKSRRSSKSSSKHKNSTSPGEDFMRKMKSKIGDNTGGEVEGGSSPKLQLPGAQKEEEERVNIRTLSIEYEKFLPELPGGFFNADFFLSVVCDSPLYLHAMEKILKKTQVRFCYNRPLNNLQEVMEFVMKTGKPIGALDMKPPYFDVVVNCCGLYGGDLKMDQEEDEEVESVSSVIKSPGTNNKKDKDEDQDDLFDAMALGEPLAGMTKNSAKDEEKEKQKLNIHPKTGEPKEVLSAYGGIAVFQRPNGLKIRNKKRYPPNVSIKLSAHDGLVGRKHMLSSTFPAYVIPRGEFLIVGGSCMLEGEHDAEIPAYYYEKLSKWEKGLGTLKLATSEQDRLNHVWKDFLPTVSNRKYPEEKSGNAPLFHKIGRRPIREEGVLCAVDENLSYSLALEYDIGNNVATGGGTTKKPLQLPFVWADNYGHGGAGWTLAWGCAQDIGVQIVKKLAAGH